MQEKAVIGARSTTVTLDGDVTSVDFGNDYKYYAVRNDSDDSVYISTVDADCTAGADGVVRIPPGDGYVHYSGFGDGNRVYLRGMGTVIVIAQDDGSNPFTSAPRGGGETTGAGGYTIATDEDIDAMWKAYI